LGALVTTKECLTCHEKQGYKLGDIRGGISVTLNSSEYESIVASIKTNAITVKIFVLLFLLSIVLLIRKQFKNNEELTLEVQKRTKEIKSTKELLQEVLDADINLLLVTDGESLIFTNKTVLDFFELTSLDEFKNKYNQISDVFEKTNHQDFLHESIINGQNWIDFLQTQQHIKEFKVLIKKENEERYFKVHAKKIFVESKTLYLIIFDEITEHCKNMKRLRDDANRDTLTKLFNRGKFNDVLTQQVLLCQTTSSPLSIIFLDIDYFKIVNDTLGHNIGDEVLIEISHILTSTVREGDFVARWGGEEFIITLQGTDKHQAVILAEKLRIKVLEHTFKSAPQQSISLGVTQYENNESSENFTKRVDKALYEAKESGRNRVVVY
jgi:diguanylate cyclase (GGDEF)-like protein